MRARFLRAVSAVAVCAEERRGGALGPPRGVSAAFREARGGRASLVSPGDLLSLSDAVGAAEGGRGPGWRTPHSPLSVVDKGSEIVRLPQFSLREGR